MTPEDRTPRKRRRRRRRTGGTGAEGQQPAGNGSRPEPGNEANRPSFDGGGGAAGRRRKRSRRGRGREGGGGGGGGRSPNYENGSSAPQLDIAPGELAPVSGVLFIKPNGTGILVDAANSYYPQPGDPIVPRSTVERLHLLPGLLLGGQARRTGNGLEFVGLETIEG